MIRGIVEGFLGNWGTTLLDFYYEYSLLINGILVVYVVGVILIRHQKGKNR